MSEIKDPHSILGVSRATSREEVTLAYRRMRSQVHAEGGDVALLREVYDAAMALPHPWNGCTKCNGVGKVRVLGKFGDVVKKCECQK